MAAVYAHAVWRQGFYMKFHTRAQRETSCLCVLILVPFCEHLISVILIKQIRTFSYYYSSRQPIIRLFDQQSNQTRGLTIRMRDAGFVVLVALVSGCLLFARLPADAHAPAPSYDLLITNARVVDGRGH